MAPALSEDIPYDIIVVGAGVVGSAAAKHLLSLNPQLKVGLVGPQVTQKMAPAHSEDTPYDVIVVGAGMVGSAAAKHLLSLNPQLKIGLVGPQVTQVSGENTIHGAHYDEGRITRELGSDHVWSSLASRSLQRYRDIERLSGISFYDEVGFLIIGKKDGPYVASVKDVIEKNDISCQLTEGGVLGMAYPYLKVTPDTEGIYTSKKSGHISPRLMVIAQRQIALMLGCDIINDVASKIEEGKGYLSLTTEKGRRLVTRKVLLATGAFTDCRDLLPKNKQLAINNFCTTTLLTEIAEQDLPHFSSMPSLYVEKDCPNLEKDCPNSGFYILPPIKYPDGKWYLKIGHSRESNRNLESAKDIDNWYKQNLVEEDARALLRTGREKIFKGMKPVSEHYDQCVIDITPSQRPFIGMVTPSIGVAVGGCGWAAKSSDEIGLVAARYYLFGNSQYKDIKELYDI